MSSCNNNNNTVTLISECLIKPKYKVVESTKPHHLTPYDIGKLSAHYIQKGLLFNKPTNVNNEPYSISNLVENLKESLELTLVHFYPLAGRFVTELDEEKHQSVIYVDCNNSPGAKFIHATLDTTISNLLSPIDIPLVFHGLFDHHKALNYDGHTSPLLSVQVTELIDGVFIGCSANHAVVDGSTYWRFWNMWSKIYMSNDRQGTSLELKPCLPIHERWFPDGCGPDNPVVLPFTHPDKFISCLEPTQLRVRMFHFSVTSLKKLKTKANEEINSNNKISSFQALTAVVWRSMVRANCVSHDQVTNCRLVADIRKRLTPNLPTENFGNSVFLLKATTTVGELLNNELGWTALLLHQTIGQLDDKAVRDFMQNWLQSPDVPQQGSLYNSNDVFMSSSPRFNMFGNEFGLGKAVAARSGYANKFQGKVNGFQGCEGGGSIDLEICLPPDAMRALESDLEFMDAVSLQ